jgi:hypothetical protein
MTLVVLFGLAAVALGVTAVAVLLCAAGARADRLLASAIPDLMGWHPRGDWPGLDRAGYREPAAN